MKRWLAVAALVLVAASAFAQGTLTLAQGKPEIDRQLKEYAAAWGKANKVEVTIKTVGGGGNDLGTELKAAYAAGDMPDIFTVAGPAEVA